MGWNISISRKYINIAAGAVTTDKLLIPGTASFDAALRLIAFRVPVSLDANSGIYQGTGTFASPTTGLKLFNSGGVGKLSTYNAGVEQVTLDTDGKLKAGAGKVALDANGLTLISDGANASVENTIKFSDAGNISSTELYGYRITGAVARRGFGIDVYGRAETDAEWTLNSYSTTGGRSASIQGNTRGGSAVAIYTEGTNTLTVRPTATTNTGGLNVGTATGAGTGQVKTSGISAWNGQTLDGNVAMYVRGVDATANTRDFRAMTPGGLVNFEIFGSGNATLRGTLTQGSDARWKKNIRPFTRGLVDVLKITPSTFERDGTTQSGFIAQDVQEAIPEAVTVINEDGYLGVNQTSLLAALFNAVRELAEQNTLLAAKVAALTP